MFVLNHLILPVSDGLEFNGEREGNETNPRFRYRFLWLLGAEFLHRVVVFLLVFSHEHFQRTTGLQQSSRKHSGKRFNLLTRSSTLAEKTTDCVVFEMVSHLFSVFTMHHRLRIGGI